MEETITSREWWFDWYETMPHTKGDPFKGGTDMEAVLLWALEANCFALTSEEVVATFRSFPPLRTVHVAAALS